MTPARAALDAEALQVMRRILAIPHDACRESALHGLGHWCCDHPTEVAAIVDESLTNTPSLRGELRDYARAARAGMVQ